MDNNQETVRKATIVGLLTGGVSWALVTKSLKEAFKKAGLPAFAVTTLWSLIETYRETEEKIEKVREKRDKTNREALELWKKYLECLKHDHASGSLSPYMDGPTNVQYGDTHYALFQASVAYDIVY